MIHSLFAVELLGFLSFWGGGIFVVVEFSELFLWTNNDLVFVGLLS